jgi:hypothetical protein
MARQIIQSFKKRSLLFYFISLGLAILLLVTFKESFLDFTEAVSIGVGLCLFSLLSVAINSRRGSGAAVQQDQWTAEKLKQEIEEWVPEESPAVMLGASGIYSIVFGLGIVDALNKYAEFLNTIRVAVLNAPMDILGAYDSGLSYTFRLLGFLVTIIPFIHGALLMFSWRWYFNKGKNTYHFGLAFIFFIFAFIHTVLFFFVALNIPDTSLFLLILWIIMIVNIGWLLCQVKIARKYLGRNEYFLTPWILINTSTFVFLTMFILAPPGLLADDRNTSDDLWLNVLILVILVARSVVDYLVGWKSLYNKLPKRNKMVEILTLSSILLGNGRITPADFTEVRNLAAKKLSTT